MDTFRTPNQRFKGIPNFPFQEHYFFYDDIRLHYVDEGNGETILCLHGEPTWSYLYRHIITGLSNNYRVIVPDLTGFGKSDKLIHTKDYSYTLHYKSLEVLILQLSLTDFNLVIHDWGGLIGLGLLGQYATQIKRLIIMNTFFPLGKPLPLALKAWKVFACLHPNLPIGFIMKLGSLYLKKQHQEILSAYKAPFPSRKYKAGAIAFPRLLPKGSKNEIIPYMKSAYTILQNWQKPAMVIFSDKDPVYKHWDRFFARLIPSVAPENHIIIKNAGHFLQEDKGREITGIVRHFLQQS